MRPTVFLGLMVLGAVVLGANLWGYDLWPPDEPRFAQVAREMLESGDWLVLRINGEPYLEKPPAVIWAIAAASAVVGEVTPWATRLPSFVSALVVLACTIGLARRIYGEETAWWSGLVLMTSLRFWWQAHTAQMDMALAAAMAVCLWAAWRWHTSRRGGWLVVLWGAMTAGLYIKGPPALLFPLLLVAAFYWRRGAGRRATHWVLGSLAGIGLIALWAAPARMAVADEISKGAALALGHDLWRQVVGRVFLGISKANWPWYYLAAHPLDWLPWSLFLPWTALYVWRHRKEGDGTRFLLSWLVPAFVVFSLIIGKRAQYLLPLAPAIAIFIGRSIEALNASNGKVLSNEVRVRRGWVYVGIAALVLTLLTDPAAAYLVVLAGSLLLPFESERRRVAVLWGGLLCVLAAAPFALLATEHAYAWQPQLLALTLVCGGLGLVSLTRGLRRDVPEIPGLIFKQFFLVLLALVFFAFPVVNVLKSAKSFCEPVRSLAEAGAEFRLYSVFFVREEYVFYSHHHLTEALIEPPELPQGITPQEAKWIRDFMRNEVRMTAEELGLEDLDDLSPEVMGGLRAAAELPANLENRVAALEVAKRYRAQMQGFVEEFMANGPAFAYMQRRDWLLLRCLPGGLGQAKVVKSRGVGSRNVVLVANAGGHALLERN